MLINVDPTAFNTEMMTIVIETFFTLQVCNPNMHSSLLWHQDLNLEPPGSEPGVQPLNYTRKTGSLTTGSQKGGGSVFLHFSTAGQTGLEPVTTGSKPVIMPFYDCPKETRVEKSAKIPFPGQNTTALLESSLNFQRTREEFFLLTSQL